MEIAFKFFFQEKLIFRGEGEDETFGGKLFPTPPVDRTLMRGILTSKPTFIQGVSEKLSKTGNTNRLLSTHLYMAFSIV